MILSFSDAMGQTITSVSPNSGTPGQYVTITIIGGGTHFRNGVSKILFSSKGIRVVNFNVLGNSQIEATATIFIDSGVNTTYGFSSITITTGSEKASTSGSGNGFKIFSDATSGSFTANLDLMPLESINLKNIDLTNPSSQPLSFIVNEYNGLRKDTVNVKVSLFNSSNTLLAYTTYNSQVIPLNNNNIPVSITNRNFSSVTVVGQAGNTLLNYVEATGNFPPDNYTYNLTITDLHGNVLVNSSAQLPIGNQAAANPELIAPGAMIGGAIADCYLSFPIFQWFGLFDQYNFAMYFWHPGQTAEEVVRTLPVYQQKGISGTSLTYPAFGEKLIDSAVYAWQITGVSGTQELPSQVFQFRYVDLGSTGQGMKKLVNAITIYPNEITLSPGQSQQFAATFFDQDGIIIDNLQPVWQLTPPDLGTITSSGLFTAGRSFGTVAVLIKADNVTQFAPITIGQGVAQATSNPGQPFKMNGIMKKMFGVNAP